MVTAGQRDDDFTTRLRSSPVQSTSDTVRDFEQNKAATRRNVAAFLHVNGLNRSLLYGHCGKKFAAKVPGEVLQSPAPGADTETFV
jgi:hypothetical protein